MAAEGPGDLPVPDVLTMEELCQPFLNGRGGPIALISIQATNIGLKNDMIQQVQNSCQFHGLPATVSQTQNIYATGAYQGNHHAQGNNQGRNQFFQEANQGQNRPPAYQAPVNQASVHPPQIPQPQVVTTNEFTNFMKANNAILKNMQTNMTSLTNSNLELKNMFGQFIKMNTNPKEDLKGITTRSGTAYQGPTIPTTTFSSLPSVVERETEATKDMVHTTNNGSTEDIQPPVDPTESPILNSEPVIAPIIEPVASPDLNFNISFADAFILMPKLGPPIKSLLTNKDKICEISRTPLNEHCSVVLLKRLPEKLGDPDKFLIPCDFPGMAECLALADLGAKINLTPLSVWNKLSLPDLSPMCMMLELVDRLISHPVGVAEYVFVKVGELTLRVVKEAITFNLDQTSRYSANYNDMTANRIDVIDMACEEYSQEVLGFSDMIPSGNPTPYYVSIVSTTSPTLTLIGDNDFLLEKVDAFLALEDDPTSSKVDQSYFDSEGDILLLEAFLNDDPSLPPPNQRNYLPQVRRNLKFVKLKSINLRLMNLLSVEEKTAPIMVLKTHKPAIAWKLSDIKGIDLEICTHKVLMEDDFELAVQHQRRVNPKIHDVIKNEVLKLLDAGLIYPISDSLWLNEATRKDHFPLPFRDQMLERLARNEYYCFLGRFLGYFQIPIDPKDQGMTTFTCPYKTFSYRLMPFGLCNAPGTFQRCMMAIFHGMIEKTMEVFMENFSVFGNSFQTCLSHLEKMLKRCEDANLCLNWEKSHFMVKEGIVLGHKISKNGIKVDKAKVEVLAKLPHPNTVKGFRSFFGHAGFYR
nr:reverse transcriptase domain-containing protein [Tanacetum cinerariifolium]